MLLQLQRYTFNLVYKPGKELIPADTLSRAYVKSSSHNDDLKEDLVCAVNLVIENLPVSDPKLKAIQDATENDTTEKIWLSQDGQGGETRTPSVPSNAHYHVSMQCIRAAEPMFMPQEMVVPEDVYEHLTDVHKGFLFASLGDFNFQLIMSIN